MFYVERLFKSLQPLSQESWFPWVMGAIAILFVWSLFSSLKSLPKLVMYPLIGATCIILAMTWVGNRNEPAVLTPVVDFIEPWLPAAR